MSRVDFYVLSNEDNPERFICALAGKIRKQGLAIHIHHDDRQQASVMDDMLWTYKDISFLPHAMADDLSAGSDPITLGWTGSVPTTNEVLINLGKDIPDFVNLFTRIIEIAASQDPQRSEARERYKRYREQGFELHSHDLESKS